MLAGCLLIGLIGWLLARREQDRGLVTAIGLLAVWLAVQRGYYWSIFDRGEGFFTANRLSALAIFVALLFGPLLLRRRTISVMEK